MEPKKNPKANVSRNSSLYFAIGLVLMLFITNFAINFKSYDLSNINIGQLDLEADDEEDVPITEQLNTPPPPPPPPPPAAPEEIQVVEDEEEIEETVIESTETDQEEEIEIDDVEIEEVDEETEVPFSVIEDSPIFPGCERQKAKADRKKCMQQKIGKFVNRKFNTGLGAELGLSGKQKIYVQFTISKSGSIDKIKARGPHPKLEQEAKKIVNQLPKMSPGKQLGKPVPVTFSLPIIFIVND